MNQILVTKKNKHKLFFKFQLFFSIISVIVILLYFFNNYIKNKKKEEFSKIINNSLKISNIYEIEQLKIDNNIYFGKINIPKINLEYTVFNCFNEELLKIFPCKFYGVNLGEKGNICIAGHNYNDSRFFR